MVAIFSYVLYSLFVKQMLNSRSICNRIIHQDWRELVTAVLDTNLQFQWRIWKKDEAKTTKQWSRTKQTFTAVLQSWTSAVIKMILNSDARQTIVEYLHFENANSQCKMAIRLLKHAHHPWRNGLVILQYWVSWSWWYLDRKGAFQRFEEKSKFKCFNCSK